MNRDLCGFDLGTMFCVSAKTNEKDLEKVKIESLRNMFLKVNYDDISSTELSETDLDYIEYINDYGEVEGVYIIGEDSYKLGNIFNRKPNRPMKNGTISPEEIDAFEVLYLMTEKLIGKSKNGLCVYSVPAPSVDIENPPNVKYHEKVFEQILNKLGYNSIPINESQAIIYSECQDTKLTGIAISFGCGMTNVCCCYKGTPTLQFSIARGGDWIDESVATALNSIQNRVANIKERKLDFNCGAVGLGKNKREIKIINALKTFYMELIKYVLYKIKEEFNRNCEDLEIDDEMPIVVSGGTSKPNGFIELFKEAFDEIKDFPYEISEIRHASNPLQAVAKGCLVYSIWKNKKSKEKEVKKDNEK